MRGKGPKMMEEKREFEEEVLQIDRVTRVVKGGRRLSFRATIVIGDRKGRVGIGLGKSTEVATAIRKGLADAKKHLIRVSIKNDTIPHEVRIKYKSAKILIMPAKPGTGIIAGGATRKILALAGVRNILSKSFGTNNRIVAAQATIKALSSLDQFTTDKEIAKESPKKETVSAN